MKLPNAESAVIDLEKLRAYSLNPNHPEGKHKARVFQSRLGFIADDAERLREMVLSAVLTTDTIEGAVDKYGSRYVVDFPVQGLHGMVMIRTAWIIDAGETIPRLVSCYVKRK
ncbi:MAG TPA: hypothetical protein VF766_06260 [Pyrinomonadaceae bacterium]